MAAALSSFETGKYVWDLKNPITGEEANIRRGAIDPDRNNFQPRFGLAYSVDSKTVLRSSFGVFYDSFGVNYAQTQQGNRGNWPFSSPQTVTGLNSVTPNALFPNPFPGPAQGSLTPLGCQQCLNVYHDTSRTPYVLQWTFSIQRQITPTIMAEGVYFGSHGVRISGQLLRQHRRVPRTRLDCGSNTEPQFPSYISNGYNGFHSYYEGMSLKLDKRFSRGLQIQGNFTWSKTLDQNDSLASGGGAVGHHGRIRPATTLRSGGQERGLRYSEARLVIAGIYDSLRANRRVDSQSDRREIGRCRESLPSIAACPTLYFIFRR